MTIDSMQRIRGFQGTILTPFDSEYEKARRVWNGMIDKHPALIACCCTESDVVAAINHARTNGLRICVRGGGHSVAGNSVNTGGVIVDLSQMRTIDVDPHFSRVSVGGGATLGDIDTQTSTHGIAVPLGVVSATGVGGLSLGGGYGWLGRRYGLTADNLVSADVITADGRKIHANEEENCGLYWALRGGGGGYCAVTRFEFQAHPVNTNVWMAMPIYPMSRCREILQFLRDFLPDSPRELSLLASIWQVPDIPEIASELRCEPAILLLGCYSGTTNKGEGVLRPL